MSEATQESKPTGGGARAPAHHPSAEQPQQGNAGQGRAKQQAGFWLLGPTRFRSSVLGCCLLLVFLPIAHCPCPLLLPPFSISIAYMPNYNYCLPAPARRRGGRSDMSF
jgi:hypothetical protein